MLNVGEFKVQVRQSWWWKPALKAVYVAAVCRLIPLSTAEKLASTIVNNSFKYRIGKKKWQKINGIQLTVERQ